MKNSRLPMDYGEWLAYKAGESAPTCRECRNEVPAVNDLGICPECVVGMDEEAREEREREMMNRLHMWNQAYHWSRQP